MRLQTRRISCSEGAPEIEGEAVSHGHMVWIDGLGGRTVRALQIADSIPSCVESPTSHEAPRYSSRCRTADVVDEWRDITSLDGSNEGIAAKAALIRDRFAAVMLGSKLKVMDHKWIVPSSARGRHWTRGRRRLSGVCSVIAHSPQDRELVF
jgi:hypothetical protein